MQEIARSSLYADRSDVALLAEVLDHRAPAFAELLRRYRGLLFRCITRITARYERVLGSEDVEEIFAELCVALWADDLRRLRAFNPARGMKLSSWLGLIATHATYDFLRRVARRPPHDDLSEIPERTGEEPSALDRLLDGERRDFLGVLTGELSTKDRAFVAVYFSAEQAPEDVAQRLGISVKTVYSKKNKITTRLSRRAAEVALAA